MANQSLWWKEAIVYQIYPKSFLDSNGDGVGDLPGVISKLDYLRELGVDVLWLNPIYHSPDVDNGYDISDYQAINPQFGSLADLDLLLEQAHQRNMKVIMDVVVNHTSNQHPWFVESSKSRENPHRDYYIWRDGKEGREPNNWGAHFAKSAWSFDPQTGQYYLHIFSRWQPDLNWDNPQLRAEIHQMMNWWLDRGIDGFRLDAINFISKAEGLPDNYGSGEYIFSTEHFKNGPAFHDYLREMRQRVFSRSAVLTVGECAGLTVEDAIRISAPERQELDMTFLFEHTDYYSTVGKDPAKLKQILTHWQTGLHGRGWTGVAFNSHDLPRVVSTFGNDAEYRIPSAKLFATLLLTLEGTPFLYQGEEIGMTSVYYDSIEEYNDVATHNHYAELVAGGVDPQTAFAEARRFSRDRGRSPFQWSSERNAGFTTGKPWLGLNRNAWEINLERDLRDENSIFRYYQKMIAIRKQTPALVDGEFAAQDAPDELFVFRRSHPDEVYQVVLNLSEQEVSYTMPGELVICNYAEANAGKLQPYEARLYALTST